ncbi:hypothetical protein M407DRAFT_29922 [Tulasnella calospora MUT 4182]|uniref:Uncharacterized protein n=1 Tax=Tulasnella calospora MUT 4182 TaxID=1051891 RepID=A0A0C3Q993_9AGAM|nr:hypothetical protein M407DRAFT_29922 [Tulasnella calospora MUT 4182]
MKRDARIALEKCKELHIASEHPDEQILEHTKELIGELEAQGFHGTTPDDEAEDAQEGEAGEWVDEDGSDIEMS